LGIEADIELYMYKKGYEGKNIEPLKAAIEAAHENIFQERPKGVDSPICSMWRDINAFNAVGIPSITYGPGSGLGRSPKGAPFFTVEELLNAAKLYALIALKFCN